MARGNREQQVSGRNSSSRCQPSFSKPGYLCSRCHRIPFRILDHPEKIKSRFGTPLLPLGSSKDWNTSSCKFCQLLHFLQSADREHIDNPDTQKYHLYAYSSSRSYYHKSNPSYIDPRHIKTPARTILGIMPSLLRYGDEPGGPRKRYQYAPSSFGFISSERSEVQNGFQTRLLSERTDFSIVKRWMSTCSETHGDHREAHVRMSKSEGIFRLIDCETRRIVVAQPNNKYLALSYVWGISQDPAATSLDILPASIPAVVEDALLVVLSLEYQYLWVDRYCIRQDDPNDKLIQIPHMDSTYQNAQLTIIAAAGDGPHYGLPGVGHRLRAPQRAEMIGEYAVFAIPPEPSRVLQRSRWAQRAWTYQEAVLSQRLLIFTDQEVYFECKHMTCRELVDAPESIKRRDDAILPWATSLFPPLGQSPQVILKHIAQYSRKQLTFDEDILDGIRGVFRAYRKLFPSFHDLHGVPLLAYQHPIFEPPCSNPWTRRFLTGLGWISEYPSQRRKSRHGSIIFPSWSWCGWTAPPRWNYHNSLVDRSVSVKIYVLRNGKIEEVNFEKFGTAKLSVDWPTFRICMTARVIRLRFEFVEALPQTTSSNLELPRFGITYRNWKGEMNYMPLFLDCEVDAGSQLDTKLRRDFWECIVIGVWAYFDNRQRTVIVCEWEGNTARRIGLVEISRFRFDEDSVLETRKSFWFE